MTHPLYEVARLEAALAAMKGRDDARDPAPLLPPGEAWEVLVARGLMPPSWPDPSDAPVAWGCRPCLRSKRVYPDHDCLFCRGVGEVDRPDALTMLAAAAAGPDVLATVAGLAGALSRGPGGRRAALLAESARAVDDLLLEAADALTAFHPWEVYAAEWAREHVACDGFDEAAMAVRYGPYGSGFYPALARLRAMGVHALGHTAAGAVLLVIGHPCHPAEAPDFSGASATRQRT